ncbi:PREDICTED: telomere repeat-binding protein 4-like [Lupinus angustifolius]|uniref:telomere repeat-binding protein 4-like n=1 Tax=Lupinus angustifolius TaxID=3871 RepID=UPI00092E5F1E|nr:PREDICTED: telomere repeat-binding protein 4-like [Lupinus angustifolius]XP_019450229.1 PREDICTED: telomere repeat-binding protein 4-like [Lupinus angustifolius]XP_019450230.1 PREDICTED: telomere repeat-binding protein 4-like [Lupinus angustifolius]XP_019450231.1 PREDICTED: telomere repeat-binding protein 4-like [Lupinus angustifolius]XP_019450232.1 PREDICTED: telomere repeat-binding protein 4-like [Lupinus angustifolius]
MVLQKRLNYGFNGFQVPTIPTASRSARGRGTIRKRCDNSEIQAFEILASVAGNFLQENDSSILDNAASEKDHHDFTDLNIKHTKDDGGGSFNGGLFENGTCIETVSTCLTGSRGEHDNQRVMGESSLHGNNLEGQGQNVLEREDERMIHIKGNSGGLIEPRHRSFDSLPDGSTGRKLVTRDDGENFVRCTQLSSKNKKISGPPPDMLKLKDISLFTSEENNSRHSSVLDDPQRMYPFKKRKFFNQTSSSASDRGSHCQGIFDSSDTKVNGANHGAAIEESSSMAGQRLHPGSKDCNVKLSIKSFKVPELFIDIPETATIGSLKRTVLEAVTAVLGDELHVGILLQGKKIRDDNKTLFQTGISQDDKRHRLGFMLEPRHNQISPPSYNKDPCFLTTYPRQKLSRQSTSLMLQQGTYNVSQEHSLIKIESCAESDLNVVSSLTDTSANNNSSKCRTLVAVPAINMGALAMVPFRRKSGNHDFSQRRIRRPFSVLEVEALVQAVEKLGTGRWRDVKQCAFDNAKHRTYVDLKDKWKTLVHTARISPQQRRGEPVPQELLDRVLTAHAYWSQQQCKHQLKPM